MLNSSYNVVLRKMLASFAEKHDWEGMADYLEFVSNAQFRAAGVCLSTDILRNLPSDCYWSCFLSLVGRNSKAHLMTFLKAAVQNYVEGKLLLNDTSFMIFGHRTAEQKNIIDEKKTLQTLLPVVKTSEEIEYLFRIFEIEDINRRIQYLTNVDTMVCYYVLFTNLRQYEQDNSYVSQCCLSLMKKGTRLAYNLASILKCYFDLPGVRGQFSLTMKPFELSRLEKGFTVFKEIMLSI